MLKEILDKIEESANEIKLSANHGFGLFCIFICSLTTCVSVRNIEQNTMQATTYMRLVLDQLQDTIQVKNFKYSEK